MWVKRILPVARRRAIALRIEFGFRVMRSEIVLAEMGFGAVAMQARTSSSSVSLCVNSAGEAPALHGRSSIWARRPRWVDPEPAGRPRYKGKDYLTGQRSSDRIPQSVGRVA